MTDKKKEKEIDRLMNCGGYTREEAEDIYECDRRIDKGEKLFELPEELKQGAKKARMSGNTKGYTKANREKKVDTEKGKLIADLLDGIGYAENVKIVNREREFTFEYKGRKFKVVLSCPRS